MKGYGEGVSSKLRLGRRAYPEAAAVGGRRMSWPLASALALPSAWASAQVEVEDVASALAAGDRRRCGRRSIQGVATS